MANLKICKNCGNNYSNSNKHFCSTECKLDYGRVTNICFCGEKVTSKKSVNKKYCNPDCYFASIKNIKYCAYCGKEYDNQNDKYCEKGCAIKAQTKYVLNLNGSKKRELICKHCNNKFIGYKRNKYCPDCKKKATTGENNWRWNQVYIECDYCGEFFWQEKVAFEKNEHNFNSRQCQNSFNGLKIRGNKNHKWKGGVTTLYESIRKSEKYKDWRMEIYKRDKFKCVICGENNKINAHHIISFSYILENLKVSVLNSLLFSIDNGSTLCKDCHVWVHKEIKNSEFGNYRSS